MVRYLLFFGSFFLSILSSHGQKITNLILVGTNGVTEDVKQAHSFILVKELPNHGFERYDYKVHGPLVKLKTYKDTAMTVLDGRYLDYYPSGYLRVWGHYLSNQKTGSWYTYNESGEGILIEKYLNGNLISSENLNAIDPGESTVFGDEREAEFRGGQNSWKKYLIRKLTNSIQNRYKRNGVRSFPQQIS